MTTALIDQARGPESLALPQLTPDSFASLPDAFCAALNAVTTLLKVVEELYAICQDQQLKLEESLLHSAPDLSARCTVQSEQKRQEERQDERINCAASLVSGHSRTQEDDHRRLLCKLESVLQAARLLNCNAEQYGHLITAVQPPHQSPQLPVSETLAATAGETPQSISYASTHTPAERKSPAIGMREDGYSRPQTAFGELLHKKHSPSTRTTRRGSIAPGKEGHIRVGATGGASEASEKVTRRSRSKSTVSNDYELSVCKALLMLQQLDLHEETACSEEECFFTVDHRQTRQQPTLVDTQNYARSAPQRETFYDLVRKEVQERQAPLFRHELKNSWQYRGEDSRRHQQLHPRPPLNFQSVLAGGPFIRLDKRLILEMLLRIKVLQEAQRMLRADIIMLRHQHFADGQMLLLTLQKTVTKSGLERKALLFRLQKLAALLQNK